MSPSEVTETQERVIEGVRNRLRRAGAVFSESLATKPEAIAEFVIETRTPESLRVQLIIVADRFGFVANNAEFWADLPSDPQDSNAWVTWCLEALDALLANELRIRVRKGLLGGLSGAVWVPMDGGAWHGELGAVKGKGTEYVFQAPWYMGAL